MTCHNKRELLPPTHRPRMTGQGWRGYPAESAYDIASQIRTDMNPS